MSPTRAPATLARSLARAALAIAVVLGAAAPSCGGGGGSSQVANPSPASVSSSNLAEEDVDTIALQAINQAGALGAPATIAIVDRVGNVLTVAQMTGAPAMATVTSATGVATTAIPPGWGATVDGFDTLRCFERPLSQQLPESREALGAAGKIDDHNAIECFGKICDAVHCQPFFAIKLIDISGPGA